MIAQKYRFHGHGSLRYVYRHGEHVRTRTLTLRYSFHPQRQEPRFTVIVAKKVLKKAVQRNRIRRRLYEMLRELTPHFPSNADVALTVFSSELLLTSSADLKEQLMQILERTDLLKKQP